MRAIPLNYIVSESPGQESRSRISKWMTFAAWSLLPLLLLGSVAIHNGRVLTLLFTPVALMVGGYFFCTSAGNYISFVICLFSFSAFIRRIADFFSAYTESNPIILAPYIVAGLTIFSVLRFRKIPTRSLPFALVALGLLYGLGVGLLNVGGFTVLKSLIRWVVPITVGIYCTMQKDRNKLIESFLSTTLWCSIVGAFYGIIQFIVAPAWDTAWLLGMRDSSGAGSSFGQAVPFGLRVFSTMNSPALCASFCAIGLLCALRLHRRSKYLIMLLLLSCLMLTLVRTVWLSTFLLVIVVMWRLYGRRAFRLVAAATFCGVLLVASVLPFVNFDPDSAIGQRFSSFGSLNKDDSYRVRSMGISRALTVVETHPFGEGMGYMESHQFFRSTLATLSSLGSHDIGALEIPFELGYLGTVLYLSGMAFACITLIRALFSSNKNNIVLAACGLNACLLFASTNPLIAYDGILFWLATGLLMEPSYSLLSARSSLFGRRGRYSQVSYVSGYSGNLIGDSARLPLQSRREQSH